MKKIVVTIIFLLSIILISMQKYNVKAVATEEDMEKYDILDLTIEDIEKDYTLYILLSKEYIEYAINLSGLDITYNGANTLIENDIPGIEIIKENVQQDIIYIDNVEYVQIKLQNQYSNNYQFKILKQYGKFDMKFKIILDGENESNIMNMDNFKTGNDGICKIIYNDKNNTLKNLATMQGSIAWWQILLVILIILFIIFITKKR